MIGGAVGGDAIGGDTPQGDVERSDAAAAGALPAVVPTIPTTLPPRFPPFTEVNASGQEKRIAQQAIAILQRHGALATRRHGALWQPGPHHIKQLSVNVCSICNPARGELGTAQFETWHSNFGSRPAQTTTVNSCVVMLNMPPIRHAARAWDLSVTLVTALTIAHEQEHCVRFPDHRERRPVDAEVRLARKLRNARLIEFAASSYPCLDERDYWKPKC